MRKKTVRIPLSLAFGVLLAAAAGSASAQEPGQQREHTVRRGDTLWDLARTYLNNPFLWRLIAEANPVTVEDPHWIYPTERLIIPGLLQRPAAEPIGTGVDDPAVEFLVEPVIELEPDSEVISLDLRRPVVTAAEYLSAPWLSTAADRLATGRITSMAGEPGRADRLASALYPHDRVVVEGGGASPGDSLLVVRIGRRVGSSGHIVQPVGLLAVEESAGGMMKARMVSQFGDARVGDVVIPLSPLPAIAQGEPDAVESGVQGRLLQFLTDEELYGTADIAFVSVGRNAGVGIGDEFGVYLSSPDGMLSPERVATARVVRADEGTATVRVLNASSLALGNGLPVRLIRRMQ